MTILQFLDLIHLTWSAFSKNRQQYIQRWSAWDSGFSISGRGQSATVYVDDLELFRFVGHARRTWGINNNINYYILYKLYIEIQRKQGRVMPSLARFAAQHGVHANTISNYIDILVEAGLIVKTVWNIARTQKRLILKPQFHERFK